MKTIRGFEVQHFRDDYGLDCSIQESSAVEPHIWLGVHNPPHKIMWDSAGKYGIEIGEKAGWYDYPIPEDVLVESRMHLSQEQAESLAKQLLYFAKHGVLKEEKEKEKMATYQIEIDDKAINEQIQNILNGQTNKSLRIKYNGADGEISAAVDVRPVVKAYWNGEGDGYADGEMVYDVWSCSNCGYTVDEDDCEPPRYNYCPNCGASMDGGQDR